MRQRPTRDQIIAIKRLWERNPDGSPSYLAFRRRFEHFPTVGCIGARWCNMFIGIEPDGYTHS